MPIYEFFCPDCNTVFSFFSATIRTDASPACPRCARPGLERRPSRFAAITRAAARPGEGGPDEGGTGGEGDEGLGELFPGADPARLEGAMERMAQEMERLPEDQADDPRQMARFFRRFGEMSGLELGPKMEDMIRRLEAGEDPEAFDEEMAGGDAGEGDEGEGGGGDEDWNDYFRLKKKVLAQRTRPKVDDTLYFL